MINKKNLKIILNIVLIVSIMVLLAFIYSRKLSNEEIVKKDILEDLYNDVVPYEFAYLNLYTIYGNHLNVNGVLNNKDNLEVKNMKIILKDYEEKSIEYDLNYDFNDNKYNFYLSKNINEGIDLEKIENGKYFVLLKVEYSLNDELIDKIYTIKNNSDYSQNEYHTMTKNMENKKIEIFFREYNKDNKNLNYMQIKVLSENLPENVYDIVIDPGHGGKDPGAMYDGKRESDLTLEYSILLKQKLEEIGYKVKLTRTKDEYVESYGKNARATTPYETKAKLVLSIHLNSTEKINPQGGVEIYASNDANLDFAKSFADNIVNYTGTGYSPNNISKALDGVYVRTYTEEEIKEAIEYANELEYTPYETLSVKTPYLFMIRETGGIMTHAYVDGRNKYIDSNPYYNSNQSAEAYLLELGFINSENDINNLLKNKNLYINAIVDSIKNHYINY